MLFHKVFNKYFKTYTLNDVQDSEKKHQKNYRKINCPFLFWLKGKVFIREDLSQPTESVRILQLITLQPRAAPTLICLQHVAFHLSILNSLVSSMVLLALPESRSYLSSLGDYPCFPCLLSCQPCNGIFTLQ